MNLEFSADISKTMQCKIVEQDINPAEIKSGELPTDVHLVHYRAGDADVYDLVRAFKMVDIFDPYHDALKAHNGHVISIKSGYGKIHPRMFGLPQPKPMDQSRSESPFA